jgi:hypothetical protein
MSRAPFTIYRFWTEHPTNKAGGFDSIDWVEYGPFGSDKTKNTSKVSTLVNYEDHPTNPASKLAKIRGEYIKEMHTAWKNGQGMPETGTPLSAWNGITPEQADILRTKGFKSVEDIAAMTDTHRASIPLPGLLKMCEDAKRFLAAADRGKLASELGLRDEELARLREQQAEDRARQNEMARMIEELLAEKRDRVLAVADDGEPAPPKRGPGRPRNDAQVAA